MGMKKGYWASAIEMTARAFEAHVIHKMKQAGGLSDYLANVTSKETWDVIAPPTVKEFGNDSTYPYPTEAEIGGISAAFDALFGAIETRETERGVEMHMRERPVVTLSGAEMTPKKGIEALREAARRYFRERLMGLTVDSKALGPVKITKRGADKTLSSMADPDKARLVPAITAILRHGRLVGSDDARGKEPRIRRYHYLTAPVLLDGRTVIAGLTVEERADGSLYYNINRHEEDTRLTTDRGAGDTNPGRAEREARPNDIAVAPDEINLDLTFGDGASQAAPPSPAQLRAATAAVNREVERAGLGARVTGRVVEGLLGALGQPILGRATGAAIEVDAAAADPAGVARHEIVHVLRDSALWGKPYGLFAQEEWRSLVRAARADAALMESVAAAYPDLNEAGRIEEAVAEMYREWAQGREGRGALARLFERMRDFFRAVGAALRGEGLNDAADVMRRMERGEIGRRSTTRMLASGELSAEMRPTVAAQIKAAWDGAQPDAPIVLGRFPAVFRALTGKDSPFVVASSVIRKAGNHGLTLNDVYAAINGLESPVMVFDSTNETGNLTALVEAGAEDGRSMVVAVDAAFRAGKVEVSRIATIHGKNEDAAILNWMRNGYLRYLDKKKAGAWARSRGRQLPKDMELHHRLGRKILRHADVFKQGDDGTPPQGASRELRFLNRLPRARDEAAVNANERTIIDRLSKAASNTLTDAMGGASERYNLLALVPGRALFQELGKALPSANADLRTKEEMDALRNEWHAETDRVAWGWCAAS